MLAAKLGAGPSSEMLTDREVDVLNVAGARQEQQGNRRESLHQRNHGEGAFAQHLHQVERSQSHGSNHRRKSPQAGPAIADLSTGSQGLSGNVVGNGPSNSTGLSRQICSRGLTCGQIPVVQLSSIGTSPARKRPRNKTRARKKLHSIGWSRTRRAKPRRNSRNRRLTIW